MTNKSQVRIDGRTYRKYGYFGCLLQSEERKARHIKRGDVRYISSRLFYAHWVERHLFAKTRIMWAAVEPLVTPDAIWLMYQSLGLSD